MPLFAQSRDEREFWRASPPRGRTRQQKLPDAFFPVDHGVLVHDRDRARRTETRAVAAAGAALAERRFGAEQHGDAFFYELPERLIVRVRHEPAACGAGAGKVVYMVRRGVLHAERLARLGEEPALLCRRGGGAFSSSPRPRAQPVELIGVFAGESAPMCRGVPGPPLPSMMSNTASHRQPGRTNYGIPATLANAIGSG